MSKSYEKPSDEISELDLYTFHPVLVDAVASIWHGQLVFGNVRLSLLDLFCLDLIKNWKILNENFACSRLEV